jgi:hypothetical protein
MPISRAQRCRIAIALSIAPMGALAQPVAMPVQVSDVLSFEVAGGLEHHSNIFRLRDGPSDTVLRGVFGVRFERDVSLQRFGAYATLIPVKYIDFSRYDYLGWDAGATWDWEIGRPIFGQLSVRYNRIQTPFDTISGAQNNLQDILNMRGLAGFRLTQAWAAIGAIDFFQNENSLFTQQPSNFDRFGVEAGLRYAPGTAIELDFVGRREEGEYPNRQVFDAVGNLLPQAIDNAFSQDALLMRVGYRPTDATRIVGNIGYTRRSYENIPERDFSGVTAGLDFEWPVSGAVQMRASVFRTIDSADLLTANYVDVIGFGLRPTWRASGRVSIEGIFTYADRTYEGDPGFVFTGQEVRKDKLIDFGFRVNYELARRVFLYADLRRLDRSSNYDELDFSDSWFGLGVRAAF